MIRLAVNRKTPVGVLLVLALAGCGGSGGGPAVIPEPPPDDCGPVGVPDGGGCRIIAVEMVERIPTPFVENGQSIGLEVVMFRPLEPGRYPTLVFHHGSTGNGSDPTRFGLTFTSAPVVRHFVER